MKRHLILRADAGVRSGLGHLMRSLSLGSAWRATGRPATLVTATTDAAVLGRAAATGVNVVRLHETPSAKEDLSQTLACAGALTPAWVVLDGYGFSTEYQQCLREVAGLLVIDDNVHLSRYEAHVLLNQNVYAPSLEYPCSPGTRLLLGTRYALLSSVFTPWRGTERETPAIASRVLVTLGGADPNNVTRNVIAGLGRARASHLEIVVVVGPANPHHADLQVMLPRLRAHSRLVRDAVNMPELMAWADMAVCGGGTTSLELAFMGVPMLTVQLAGNQIQNATALESNGAATNLGWHASISEDDIAGRVEALMCDREARTAMTRRGRELVDGFGCERVIRALMEQPCEPAAKCR